MSDGDISTGLNKDADSGTETLESSDADSEGESSDDGQKLEINNDKYLKVPTLYDNGSDCGAVTQELNNGVSLYTLKSRRIAVQTVSGIEEKDYTKRKIKIGTYRNIISNYDSIVVSSIGQGRRGGQGICQDHCRAI